ncbi:MAG: PTS fructose transporter subunit IIA [Pantoea sp.]|jgi:PTS system mannose-specific IIA component|uniref:PTS fructose transporter subunit IIA n=1 Tax=Pantoea brenneri TaxID=472694 RepID=A0AAX3IZT5_9GAMM|nr:MULTISPECIES: PTS fructose transporter subunit IIA [Pantoea]MBS6031857.1 PTS fructose transporter subunit IIA [Pantoea sp.]MDH2122392.1 PTS fructose transporter subunit IIA [Pantoea brenneri]VXA96334.1 PTS fructose transporter subunit IIA [Pantoea brenneri]
MIHVILTTHGPMAESMLASASMVYGDLPHVFPVMLTEASGITGFREAFGEVLRHASHQADGVLVLCDLQSGTPWNIACHHAFNPETTPPMAVLGGVNFPMLLLSDEITSLNDVNQAAATLLEQAGASLVIARQSENQQSDDF